MSPAIAAVGDDVHRGYPARRCIPVLPVVRSAIHLRGELDVDFVLGVDRCRVSRQEIARHKALIARIRARYADGPVFELAIAEAEGWNIVCRTDTAGAGHDDEPEGAQQRFGDRSGFCV